MFKWFHECSTEIDAPIQVAWDFYLNPNNWPKWEDRFESCSYDGKLRVGSIIFAKLRKKNVHLPIFVTEIYPDREIKMLFTASVFTQESLYTFQEISPLKTCIKINVCVISPFVPFMKSFLLKSANKCCTKAFSAINEKIVVEV